MGGDEVAVGMVNEERRTYDLRRSYHFVMPLIWAFQKSGRVEEKVRSVLRIGSELADFGGSLCGAGVIDEEKEAVIEESKDDRGLTTADLTGILAEGDMARPVLEVFSMPVLTDKAEEQGQYRRRFVPSPRRPRLSSTFCMRSYKLKIWRASLLSSTSLSAEGVFFLATPNSL